MTTSPPGGATAALSAEQGKALKQALDGKIGPLPPVVLTAATTLYADLHGGRQLVSSTVVAVTHTLATDAQAAARSAPQWVTGDSVDMIAAGGSTGVPTIAAPNGKTITLTTAISARPAPGRTSGWSGRRRCPLRRRSPSPAIAR